MSRNRSIVRSAAILLLSVFCLQSAVYAAEEKMAWDIWQILAENPEDLSGVITECETFMSGRQTDQIAPVVIGILAWSYFKTGKMVDGGKLLMSMERRRSTPISTAGSDMARKWLTRIDIKLVQAALMIYYRKYQEFPATLKEALDFAKETQKFTAPSKDRWGKPWEYDLVGFKTLTKVPKNQKYALGCNMLGQDSDYEKALEIPYAEKIDLVPMKMASTARGAESVYFKKADDKNNTPILLKVGGAPKRGVKLAFVGRNILVLSNGDHWRLVPRPRR
jgi:hypothetical protein